MKHAVSRRCMPQSIHTSAIVFKPLQVQYFKTKASILIQANMPGNIQIRYCDFETAIQIKFSAPVGKIYQIDY